MKSIARLFLLGITFISFVFFTASLNAQPASEAQFSVTNTNDAGPGSFRAALISAGAAEGPATINIDLPPNTIIDVTSASQFSNDVPVQAFRFFSNTTINGNGVILRMLSDDLGRFFFISNVTINDLILDGGQVNRGNGDGGGCLIAVGNNVINNCLIINAEVTNDQGAGGALSIFAGTTTINQTTIRNNTGARGAAVWINEDATLNLNNSTIADNTVIPNPDFTPAAIFLQGTLNMDGNIIADTNPDEAVDLFDSGNTIEINTNNLIENFVCGGASCMDEEFALSLIHISEPTRPY